MRSANMPGGGFCEGDCGMSLAALVADSDLIELSLRERARPCICGRQREHSMVDPPTSTVDYATTDRNIVVERVHCRLCPHTWSRVHCP